MLSPDSERKGLPSPVRFLLAALLAGLAMLPVTFIVGALLTPILRKLEPMLGVELGGHSGPADWVLLQLWVLLTTIVVALIVWRRRRRG